MCKFLVVPARGVEMGIGKEGMALSGAQLLSRPRVSCRLATRSRPVSCRAADKPPGYVGAIVVDNNPKPEMLAMVGVRNWPTWSCKVSEFPWHYDETEMCYVIKGSAVVTPDPKHGVAPAVICAGDFVVFPAGMDCTWKVVSAFEKHFNFE